MTAYGGDGGTYPLENRRDGPLPGWKSEGMFPFEKIENDFVNSTTEYIHVVSVERSKDD